MSERFADIFEDDQREAEEIPRLRIVGGAQETCPRKTNFDLESAWRRMLDRAQEKSLGFTVRRATMDDLQHPNRLVQDALQVLGGSIAHRGINIHSADLHDPEKADELLTLANPEEAAPQFITPRQILRIIELSFDGLPRRYVVIGPSAEMPEGIGTATAEAVMKIVKNTDDTFRDHSTLIRGEQRKNISDDRARAWPKEDPEKPFAILAQGIILEEVKKDEDQPLLLHVQGTITPEKIKALAKLLGIDGSFGLQAVMLQGEMETRAIFHFPATPIRDIRELVAQCMASPKIQKPSIIVGITSHTDYTAGGHFHTVSTDGTTGGHFIQATNATMILAIYPLSEVAYVRYDAKRR